MSLIAAQANATVKVNCGNIKGNNETGLTRFENMVWNCIPFLNSTKTVSPMPVNFCDDCVHTHTYFFGNSHALPLVKEVMGLYDPLPHDQIDNTTIYLCCGGLLQYVHHTEYGYPKYNAYLSKKNQHPPPIHWDCNNIL
eukprot:2206983-Ditylum_brightwellii.AAC.1